MKQVFRIFVCVLTALVLGGCIMPSGKPVIVEQRTGDYWSGNGVLLETSEDGQRCRVAVRDTALVVGKKWVPCKFVHARRP
jgi:hypothetical protein